MKPAEGSGECCKRALYTEDVSAVIPEQIVLSQPSPCDSLTLHASSRREQSGFRAASHSSGAAALAHAAPLQGWKAGSSACTYSLSVNGALSSQNWIAGCVQS